MTKTADPSGPAEKGATPNPTAGSSSGEERPNSFVSRLLRIRAGDIARIVIISILVGVVLAALRIDPAALWVDFFGTVTEIWRSFLHTLGDSVTLALRYFLLGAVIVVPIWIVWRIFSAVSRR